MVCLLLALGVLAVGCGSSAARTSPTRASVSTSGASRRATAAPTRKTPTHTSATASAKAKAPPRTPGAPVLQLGARGSAVRTVQAELARLTYLPASGVDGVLGMQTWHAVVAFQGWSGIQRDGVIGPQTRAALAHARRPTPWSAVEGMEIHIPQQVLLLVRGGRVWRAIHVSTGRPGWPTPEGHFEIIERDIESWSGPFEVWMPLAQYFYPGYAIHEFPEVPDYPFSHGCVRVPEAEADTVWNFGRIGMRVWTSP